jgi:hypothetical protein
VDAEIEAVPTVLGLTDATAEIVSTIKSDGILETVLLAIVCVLVRRGVVDTDAASGSMCTSEAVVGLTPLTTAACGP